MGRAMRAKRIQMAIAATVAVVAVVTALVVIGGISGSGRGATVAAGAGSGAVDATGSSVGKQFPDFALTAIDGSQVTKSSLSGKPSLIWFTTTNCVPAQVGAIKVRKLNEELGNHFRVVVVFVNEPNVSLVSWRNNYGRPDWTVARDPDIELINAVNLRYVDDTKFILNDRGNIVDVDSTPVGDGLLELMRKQVAA